MVKFIAVALVVNLCAFLLLFLDWRAGKVKIRSLVVYRHDDPKRFFWKFVEGAIIVLIVVNGLLCSYWYGR